MNLTFHAPQHPKSDTITIIQLTAMIKSAVPPYKLIVKSLSSAVAALSTSWLKSWPSTYAKMPIPRRTKPINYNVKYSDAL